jgi:ribosomal protein S27E
LRKEVVVVSIILGSLTPVLWLVAGQFITTDLKWVIFISRMGWGILFLAIVMFLVGIVSKSSKEKKIESYVNQQIENSNDLYKTRTMQSYNIIDSRNKEAGVSPSVIRTVESNPGMRTKIVCKGCRFPFVVYKITHIIYCPYCGNILDNREKV